MTYAEKLKDARWFMKRLEIIQRDNNTCIRCGEELPDNKLQVHHIGYIHNRNPWEYENKYLVTLCKDCHKFEHCDIEDATDKIIESLRRERFNALHLERISVCFARLNTYAIEPDKYCEILCKLIGDTDLHEKMAHDGE